MAVLPVQADGADATHGAPSAPAPARTLLDSPLPPLLSTNAASSTFLEAHPELVQPPRADAHDLSLRTGSASDSHAIEITPTEPGASPPTYLFSSPGERPDDLSAHLLVVYNLNDPDSRSLADYYAVKRDIPAERVLAIICPTSEEISRAQYERTIREPIINYLSQKNWLIRRSEQARVGKRMLELLTATHNDIWAIVLIRGVPLKIANDPDDEESMETDPSLKSNAAAVDSELAILPVFGLPKGGFVPNPVFDGNEIGLNRVGPELAAKMILVTRLDGPKPSDVRRMIDDSLSAEQNRLAGLAVIDSRGLTDVKNNYTSGDTWLRKARDMLTAQGWTVKFDDKPDLIPPTDPCNQVALYLGWYGGTADGPWVTPPGRFVPGAIAYHLHSFSANTVRSETDCWVGPLIAHGAAATMGAVYEPYLLLTPHLDIFTKHLLEGQSFAEAAYASQIGLSWMITVVGDPLYRPFRQPLVSALADTNESRSNHDWLLLQKVQGALVSGQLDANVETLKRVLDNPDSGAVACEGLGDLLEKLHEPEAGPAAVEAYKKALALDALPVDQIRIGLKLAQHYVNGAQDAQAQSELSTLRELYPQDADRFGVPQPLAPTGAQWPHSPPENPLRIQTQGAFSGPPAQPPPDVPPPPPQPPSPQPASATQ